MYRYLAFLLSTFLLFNCQSETTSSEETASENSSVPTQNDSDRLQAELNQIKLELRSERTLKNAFRLAEFYEQQQNQEAV
ncbi:MAG: hypothetical protein AAF599_06045, partial [Bacteroidota bacterium]